MRKKITFVREKFNPYGGAERYFQRLINTLKKLGDYEIELLEFPQPSWMPSWLKMLIFNYQACRAKKECFYFSNDRITCLDIHRAGGGTHKAFLKTKGFSLNPLHPVSLWIEKRTLENARLIIANSRKVKTDILESYDIPSKKIEIIYNGVPIHDFDKNVSRSRLKKEFQVDENEKIILYVGSGFERKGVWEFLEILSRVKKDFKAFIVGKEKRMGKYIRYAKKLGLQDKVFFTGPRKDVETFYAASDIFLFPTRYEPFSNVVLEALSFENIVFTTRQNGAHEILEEHFVMNSPNDYSVVERIDAYLGNDSNLAKAQKKARELAKQYSIERNVSKTIQVIEKAFE